MLAAGAALIAASVWYAVLTLGYRKSNTVRTNAFLVKTEYTPDINVHDRVGRLVRCSTRVWYSYTVGGTVYEIAQTFDNTTPQNLSNTVKVVYQAKRPKHAYIEGVTFRTEPFMLAVCSFLSACCLTLGVLLLAGCAGST